MSDFRLFSSVREKMRARRALKNSLREWDESRYIAPSPPHVKRAVLMRLGVSGGTWIETGTFMGDTTALLAAASQAVYTIEPDKTLYEKAVKRFEAASHVHVIHGLSETVLPDLLPKLSGTVNFWLDGHYSGGITHQGPTDCPVRDELDQIEKNISHFNMLTVLIDDVRCFDPLIPDYKDYPNLDYLVDWARRNNLQWNIEHDIFVAKSTR